MKKLYFIVFLVSNIVVSQNSSNLITVNNFTQSPKASTNANESRFQISDAGANSKYTEIGSGFFRNKFIMVSSKKPGAMAKIDPNTNEAYKELFCLDINDNDGSLSLPLLFSRILNTNDSEDQLTFSPDQKTVYYTRSSRENSMEYKLYKADLEEDSHGNWINEELLSINKENVSIENPFVNSTGDKLYFSANLPDTTGGYDIYVSDIDTDGTLSPPKNLGNTINTSLDDKYPSLSSDNKHLYFASKGHNTIGGFDIFSSKISNKGYKTPINLGNTVNTDYDEIAYFVANNENRAYLSSNKQGVGNFDVYAVTIKDFTQTLKGKILDIETNTTIPNALVILKDDEGNEIAQQETGENGAYSFDVIPFESYNITTYKDGFKDNSFAFTANKDIKTTYTKDLSIKTVEPIIAKFNSELVELDNIHFDSNKWEIREESFISLNKIIAILKEYPETRLTINAHSDNTGSDSYNLDLSKKRATSAMDYFINNSINKDRIEAIGFGETKPLIDCKNRCSKKDLQSNRRIEFVILD
ncbi:hypothetical protein A8C32_10520 [Flavivirga aquatica]|uniref:OmpA-like domain-containing protein n=1 Tax=Flavivirga aquatica TaxID=1849968 RepID=A0A1E5TCS9_9FLAO|nr:OmpA family protein [Flavivirga aquatica]OEK09158.1 hypothetical protein A8C32_10520 [Flavivirga aquatica]